MIGNKSGVNPLRRHRSSRKYDVAMYYPVPLTGKWVSHIFLSLATGFAELGARVAVGSSECALGEATNCDRIVVFDGNPRQIGKILPVTIYDANSFTLFGEVATSHVGPEVFSISLS